MQKNIGTFDAIMRITGGLTALAWATARMARRPYRGMPFIAAMMGAMKVAEGVTRFCPMLKLLGTNTLGKETASADEKQPTGLKESQPLP